jgi:hypothetical protein
MVAAAAIRLADGLVDARVTQPHRWPAGESQPQLAADLLRAPPLGQEPGDQLPQLAIGLDPPPAAACTPRGRAAGSLERTAASGCGVAAQLTRDPPMVPGPADQRSAGGSDPRAAGRRSRSARPATGTAPSGKPDLPGRRHDAPPAAAQLHEPLTLGRGRRPGPFFTDEKTTQPLMILGSVATVSRNRPAAIGSTLGRPLTPCSRSWVNCAAICRHRRNSRTPRLSILLATPGSKLSAVTVISPADGTAGSSV